MTYDLRKGRKIKYEIGIWWHMDSPTSKPNFDENFDEY